MKKISFAILALGFIGFLGTQSAFAEVGTFIGTCTYDAGQGANLDTSCIQIGSVFEALVGTNQQNKLSLLFQNDCGTSNQYTAAAAAVNPILGPQGEVLGYASPSGHQVLKIQSLADAVSNRSGQSAATYTYFADPGAGAKPDGVYKLTCTGLRLPPPKNTLIPAQ